MVEENSAATSERHSEPSNDPSNDPSRMAAENRFSTPYLGPESFQPEDSGLFFGREREAEQLIAMIHSSRCMLLHARSGAGKTSLLNALIIPRLEARGHVPIRVLFQDDPLAAVRIATLQTLLPAPAAELRALNRARNGLGLASGGTLGELLTRYDQLQEGRFAGSPSNAQELRRRLVAPLEVEPEPELPSFGRTMPYLCRLLRASVEIETCATFWALSSPHAVRSVFGDAGDCLGPQTPLDQLAALLAHPQGVIERGELIESLYLPVPGLHPFFANLFAVYQQRLAAIGEQARRGRRLSLVLIFDQFEELFTRFVDRGDQEREATPSWRLRWQFFRELESLYGHDFEPDEGRRADAMALPTRLPLRFVISIRNEFVAQLDPVRRFVPELGRATFHLELLDQRAAEEAIRKPAEMYGVRYRSDCVQLMVEQLAREERFVEPPYVQIVCDRLWRNRGSALAEGTASGEITADDFAALGGVAGILDRFFNDFLAGLTPDERLEALEMLDRLITSSRTRNIVAKDELKNVRFRRPEVREHLLTRLQNRSLVRIERRMGTHFVEILHEFLIAPIQEAIRRELTRNLQYLDFRRALDALEQVLAGPWRGPRRELLDGRALAALAAQESRLRWGYLGTEAMLRATLLAGQNADQVRYWGTRLADGEAIWDAERLLAEPAGGRQEQRLLAADELAVVRQALAAGQLDPARLDRPQVELVLRSLLVMATDAERDEIAFWTAEAQRREP